MKRSSAPAAAAAAVAIALIAAAALAVVASASSSDSTRLVVFRQIGDIRMGESEAQVGYMYGSDCVSGCAGVQAGCVLGLKDCEGPIYSYKVAGGTLDVGYIKHRVVYLATTSPRYRSREGVAVGAAIPFGKRWHQFRWHACGPSDGYWLAGTSWATWSARTAASRWWTQLAMDKGRVTVISMWRGDVNYQGC